jgi:hypothetical protein
VRRARVIASLALCAVLGVGTSVGTTVAAFTSQTSNAGNNMTAAADTQAPTLTPIVIAKTTGGSAAGAIRPGATYRVYATVADTGAPASGVSSVTANVSAITPGQTAAPMTAGSFTVDGVTYNRQSAVLTAQAGLPNGARLFSVTGVDGASNSATANGTVMVDGTAPSAANIQTANGPGNTVGRAEEDDSITWTFSEAIQPASLLANWNGTARSVTVVLTNNAGGDEITIYSGFTPVALGTIDLGRTDYTNTTIWFLGSTMTMTGSSVQVVLGAPFLGTATTAAGNGVMVWTPSNDATDHAGNAASVTPIGESGPADREF